MYLTCYTNIIFLRITGTGTEKNYANVMHATPSPNCYMFLFDNDIVITSLLIRLGFNWYESESEKNTFVKIIPGTLCTNTI